MEALLTHGARGRVTGGATTVPPPDQEWVKVLFPANRFGIDVDVHALSREAPPFVRRPESGLPGAAHAARSGREK